MFNAKYKKGIADAAKAYEAFGEKQEAALNHILEEVRQGKKTLETAIAELNGNLNGLYDHLKSKEKASLYTVYTPFDIKELGDQERLFLLGALLRLTVDKAPNENQQNYIRAVQKYLEVKEPPFGVDPMAIENIENIPSQKAILQTVLEYLRLQDGDGYDETELQQEFLDAFCLSNKVKNEIIQHVEVLYSATGAQGLAEKYGYVPEEEPGDISGDVAEKDNRQTVSRRSDVTDEIADKIFYQFRELGEGFPFSGEYIEFKDYYLVGADSNSYRDSWWIINKSTGDRELLIDKSNPLFTYLHHYHSDNNLGIKIGNTIFSNISGEVRVIDLLSKAVNVVYRLKNEYPEEKLVAVQEPYLILQRGNGEYGEEIETILYDYKSGKKQLFQIFPPELKEETIGWIQTVDNIYAVYKRGSECKIDIIVPKEKKRIPWLKFREDGLLHYIAASAVFEDTLFVLSANGYNCSDTPQYRIHAINLNNPEDYKIVGDDIIAYRYSGIVEGRNAWYFVAGEDDYPIKQFDFATKEITTICKDCGYTDTYQAHWWSDVSTLYHPSKFYIIGKSLYYQNCKRYSSDGKRVFHKVSLSDPTMVEIMDTD